MTILYDDPLHRDDLTGLGGRPKNANVAPPL